MAQEENDASAKQCAPLPVASSLPPADLELVLLGECHLHSMLCVYVVKYDPEAALQSLLLHGLVAGLNHRCCTAAGAGSHNHQVRWLGHVEEQMERHVNQRLGQTALWCRGWCLQTPGWASCLVSWAGEASGACGSMCPSVLTQYFISSFRFVTEHLKPLDICAKAFLSAQQQQQQQQHAAITTPTSPVKPPPW